METTLPVVIGFGASVTAVTALYGFAWGIAVIMIFTAVDVIFVK